jgi:hypothetical protein
VLWGPVQGHVCLGIVLGLGGQEGLSQGDARKEGIDPHGWALACARVRLEAQAADAVHVVGGLGLLDGGVGPRCREGGLLLWHSDQMWPGSILMESVPDECGLSSRMWALQQNVGSPASLIGVL